MKKKVAHGQEPVEEVDENCGNCEFFLNGPFEKSCIRYPQDVRKNPNDWCGEWKAK